MKKFKGAGRGKGNIDAKLVFLRKLGDKALASLLDDKENAYNKKLLRYIEDQKWKSC